MIGVVTSVYGFVMNFSTVYALVIGLVVRWFVYGIMRNRKYNLPPGPRPLPIVGNLFHFKGHPNVYKKMTELSKEYGPILTIQIVNFKLVILHSPELALEMLVKKSVDFAGRPNLYSTNMFSEGGNSIVFGQFGPRWQLHRKMSAHALRNYISGTMLEERVHHSFEVVAKEMAANKNPVEPMHQLSLMVFNIICGMCFSDSYKNDDPEFNRLYTVFESFSKIIGNGLIADFLPIFQYAPLSQNRKIKAAVAEFLSFLQRKIDTHRAKLDPDNLRDLTDFVLQAKKEADEEDSGAAELLSDVHIRQTIGDMFGAGVDTTRLTLYWCMYFMASNPEKQMKVQAEIDSVVGRNRLPRLKDKPELPYTDAALHECMRLGVVAPIGVPHTAMVDSTLGGYDIPKGTTVAVNVYALHKDPKHWKNTDDFLPERFLENGKMGPKPISYMPFSAGRRVCLGEAIAKPEILLAFTCIMHRFRIVFPNGKIPKFEPNCKGFGYRPQFFNVIFEERE